MGVPSESAKLKSKASGRVPEDKARLVFKLVSENVVIPDAKITQYVLNKNHSRGKHKAIVFESSLGYTQAHAEQLKTAILEGLGTSERFYVRTDEYGDLFNAIINITGPNGNTAPIRTGWILKPGETKFSLTNAIVMKREKGGKKHRAD
jgi:hypothetical protein